MPTGYTYGVQEGKITTLEDFAKSCARAFLWQARDSEEKDLRKLVTGDGTLDYYIKALKEAEDNLAEIESLDDAGWQHKYEDKCATQLRYVTEYNKRVNEERIRYTKMLEKVKDWTPPSNEHIELKKFMIEQLESSINFDCADSYMDEKPEPFDSWKKFTYESAKKSVIRAKEDVDRHSHRKNDFVGWVDKLLDSVKGK